MSRSEILFNDQRSHAMNTCPMKNIFRCVIIVCLSLAGVAARAQSNLVPDSVEFQALKDLYTSTAGASWNNKTNWPTTWPATATAAQMDLWFGILVSNGDITEISLYSNNLTGPLPASIGNLTALKSLTLHSNKL